jgi:hypothetical protein
MSHRICPRSIYSTVASLLLRVKKSHGVLPEGAAPLGVEQRLLAYSSC